MSASVLLEVGGDESREWTDDKKHCGRYAGNDDMHISQQTGSATPARK